MSTSFPIRARRALVVALPLVAAAVVLGCRGRPIDSPPGAVLDRSWLNVAQPTPDPYPSPVEAAIAGLDAEFQNSPAPIPPPPQLETRPLNVLVLSGGGKYGAFVAGFLNGWTASGCRPPFDVVTGISSGAIAAPYAVLGPKYDQKLANAFLNVRRRDLARLTPILGPFRTSSLSSSRPFERLIAREMDEEMLADLREAHRCGRRVFVATGNKVTFRPAIWDVGAVASSGRPDADALTRKVMLATAAHPGFAPPVEFDVTVNGKHYRELHQDAGNIIQAFVQTGRGLPPGSTVYVVTAGKLFRDPEERQPGVVRTVTGAASNTLYALFRADVMLIYGLCAVSRAQFRLIDLPREVDVAPGSMSFDPEDLQTLYGAGYRLAASGIPWRTAPPGAAPGTTLVPRTGLDFVTP